MTTTWVVWVSEAAGENLAIGIDQQVWGWKDDWPQLDEIQVGDWFLLGRGGSPGPRAPGGPGTWEHKVVREVVVTRVVRSPYRDSATVWHDEIYPNRIGLDVIRVERDVDPSDLGWEALEKMRLSGNKQGRPWPVDEPVPLVAEGATSPDKHPADNPSSASVWWVNQGGSFKQEAAGGYVWAPQHNKAGVPIKYHTDVKLLMPGDVIVHYAEGIRALGVFTVAGQEAPRPTELPADPWESTGYKAEVQYFMLETQIRLDEIKRRPASTGPFDQSAAVKQGYLFPLDEPFASNLRNQFEDRWPPGSPWAASTNTKTKVKPVAPSLDVQEVKKQAQGLLLDDDVIPSIVAALNSRKHVVLTGPPGTAKTTLAACVARAAESQGICAGHRLTTATSEWTTVETIGGLRPTEDGTGLEFAAGQFVSAIEANDWLIVDELNRSNFDRAFGQLFTVLAGQSVELPYHDPASGKPIELAAPGSPSTRRFADERGVGGPGRVAGALRI